MSDMNSLHNRAVWFDIPVANLDRASAFYAATLGVPVHKTEFDKLKFSVLDHNTGNGGCLIPNESEIVKPVHPIGQHGFRAVILDSEGNRIALHSTSDA
jgi:predicted enzyme related to lactoylglutathione lyase